jgi:hypothetical protein
MIHFLVDSSAVWRLQRQPETHEGLDPRASQRGHRIVRTPTRRVPSIGAQ